MMPHFLKCQQNLVTTEERLNQNNVNNSIWTFRSGYFMIIWVFCLEPSPLFEDAYTLKTIEKWRHDDF